MMVAVLFTAGDREFQTAGAMTLNALVWKLILVTDSPADRIVVDWRISDYEYKPVVLFSEFYM